MQETTFVSSCLYVFVQEAMQSIAIFKDINIDNIFCSKGFGMGLIYLWRDLDLVSCDELCLSWFLVFHKNKLFIV